MLVLTRKTQQQIQIGDNITITIIQVKGQAVRVGIEAPRETRVLRSELPKKELSELPVKPAATKRTNSRIPGLELPTTNAAKRPQRQATPNTLSPLAQILARRASGVDPATLNRNPQRSGPASLVSSSS